MIDDEDDISLDSDELCGNSENDMGDDSEDDMSERPKASRSRHRRGAAAFDDGIDIQSFDEDESDVSQKSGGRARSKSRRSSKTTKKLGTKTQSSSVNIIEELKVLESLVEVRVLIQTDLLIPFVQGTELGLPRNIDTLWKYLSAIRDSLLSKYPDYSSARQPYSRDSFLRENILPALDRVKSNLMPSTLSTIDKSISQQVLEAYKNPDAIKAVFTGGSIAGKGRQVYVDAGLVTLLVRHILSEKSQKTDRALRKERQAQKISKGKKLKIGPIPELKNFACPTLRATV